MQSTRRGSLSVHRSEKTPGSKYSSTSGLSPRGHLERQAEFHATMQGENSTDFGLLMAGSALASIPIIVVFLVFQKYFTKGITMGAVKG